MKVLKIKIVYVIIVVAGGNKDMLENLYNYYHNDMTREQIENAYTLLNDDNRLLK